MSTPSPLRIGGAPPVRPAVQGKKFALRNGDEIRLHDFHRLLSPSALNGGNNTARLLLVDLAEPNDFKYMVAWGKENLDAIRADLEACQAACRTYQNEISRALNNVNNALAEIDRAPRPAGGPVQPPPLPPASVASLPAAAAVPVLPPPPPVAPRPRPIDPFGHETGGPAGPRTQMERQRVAEEAARGGPRLEENPADFRDSRSLDFDLDRIFDEPAITAANAFTNKDRVTADLDAFDGGEFEPVNSDEADALAERLTALKPQVKGDRDLYIRVGQTISMLNLTSNTLV